uniref:Ferredoxin--nitrite reductase, chloroplastic n=1 Tax=Oryza nivara TaxID=4536 RepID=A0A0E0GCC3_ORYNI
MMLLSTRAPIPYQHNQTNSTRRATGMFVNFPPVAAISRSICPFELAKSQQQRPRAPSLLCNKQPHAPHPWPPSSQQRTTTTTVSSHGLFRLPTSLPPPVLTRGSIPPPPSRRPHPPRAVVDRVRAVLLDTGRGRCRVGGAAGAAGGVARGAVLGAQGEVPGRAEPVGEGEAGEGAHIVVHGGRHQGARQDAHGGDRGRQALQGGHRHGRFMMRLKLPNGVTTSEQTRYLASVIEAYGKDGCADVTTRQNWQIRGVTLPDVPAILDGLNAVGLTSLQSGMDNVRNPVGNPLAGIDPDEIVDTRSYTNLLSYITSNFQGNPTITNLPRKWNVCVIGSHDLYEHPHINDLAYMPAVKDGKFGFNLLVGGFISPKRWEEALPLDAWVPGDDIIPVCKAVLEAYCDLGTRGNRQKTRMMWLIDELGMEVFWSEAEKRMPNGVLERAAPEDLINKKWQRRDYLGVHPQKQEGLSYVGLHVPVGRVQAADMFELARLADEYGSGELRLTVEQNIVIPNVKDEKVEKLVSVPRAVRMHWTGCPNSCGQVQVADIGFMGCLTKDSAGKIVEAADIFVGGRVGSDSHLAGVYKKSVPCDELAPIVADILVERFGAVRREREENEE